MKKTIDIMGVDPILFVGLNDNNIKILENHFESKIVVRGSNINLDGSKSDIEKIQLVVRNMLTLINTQGCLSMDDVNDLLLNGCSLSSNNEDHPIVLHSYKGPIFAKTKGQKSYLDAVLKKEPLPESQNPGPRITPGFTMTTFKFSWAPRHTSISARYFVMA